MGEFVFADLNDWLGKVRELPLQDCPNIQESLDAIINIHKGCKCQTNNRAARAQNLYANLVHSLNESEKLFLKTSLQTEVIVFQNGADIYGKI